MAAMFGKVLVIDLTGSNISEKKIGPEVQAKYIGGKGLGSYLMLKMIQPGINPLSPQNKLIFATGPATDTPLPPAGRYGVFSKSPQTGVYAESYSGGHVAPVMKRTGYDAIVVSGAATKPCFIHISPEGVSFHDASDLWGRETYDAEKAILEAVGIKGAQVIVIGPAGEQQIRFACIKNNRWRSAGRAGLGAVMGSKNLKGIVFSGNKKVPVACPDELAKWCRDLVAGGKNKPDAIAYRAKGTPNLVTPANTVGFFPTRYWHEGKMKDWEKISADYMQKEFEVKSRSCYRCFFSCGKLTRVIKGRHQGLVTEGPEYETIYSFGGLCCISDMAEIVYLNEFCDRQGIDTISAGNIAAFAIEAGLKGRLSGAPKYGDPDSIAEFLKSVIERRGEGAMFADGIREAARQLDLEDFAIHVKGLEPAGYDPRCLKGMALAYATSDRGACHLRSTFYKAELSGMIDRNQIDGKARLFVDFEDRLNIFDTLIFCRFYRDQFQWEQLIEVIYLLTGERHSIGSLRQIAARVQDATRWFNLREGITRADDMLPPRFFREAINEGEDIVSLKDLEQMLDEYYTLRGWNNEGVPPNGCL